MFTKAINWSKVKGSPGELKARVEYELKKLDPISKKRNGFFCSIWIINIGVSLRSCKRVKEIKIVKKIS